MGYPVSDLEQVEQSFSALQTRLRKASTAVHNATPHVTNAGVHASLVNAEAQLAQGERDLTAALTGVRDALATLSQPSWTFS